MSKEDFFDSRQACVALSSYSFASIPLCDSQESCFQKASESFFSVQDATEFSFPSNQKLVDWLNYVSRSWRYFNQAKEKMQRIHLICLENFNNYAELPHLINEFNAFLLQALRDFDSASQISAEFLFLQKDFLQSQRVDLIKETNLFQQFIVIQSNTNQFQLTQKNSDLYVGQLLENVENLQALTQKTGFSKAYMREISLVELVPTIQFDSTKADAASSPVVLFLPVISVGINYLVNALVLQTKADETVYFLQKMPSFEFFSILDKLFGSTNSNFALFAETVRNESLALNEAKAENQLLHNSNAARLTQLNNSYVIFVQQTPFTFDRSLLENLYLDLNQQSSIDFEEFSIQDLNNAAGEFSIQIQALKKEFQFIEAQFSSGQMPLGEQLSRLKALQNSIQSVQSNLDFIAQTSSEDLKALCTNRLKTINQKLDFLAPASLFLSDLKQVTLKSNQEFFSTQNPVYCQKSLKLFDAFETAFSDASSSQQKLWQSFLDCRIEAQKFLENPFINSESKAKIHSLDSIALPLTNILIPLESCQTIAREAQNQIQSDPSFKAFSDFQSSIGRDFELLSAFQGKDYFNSTEFEKLNKNFKKIDSIESNDFALFEQNWIEFKKDFLADYFASNFSLLSLETQTISINQPVHSHYLMDFYHPFYSDQNISFTSALPLAFQKFALIEKSAGIDSVQPVENKLIIHFAQLHGKESIEFEADELISGSDETQLLFVDSTRAVFAQKFSFRLLHDFQNIFFQTPIREEVNPANITVLFNGQSVPFSVNNRQLVVSLARLTSSDSLLAYFSIPQPVKVSKNLIQEQLVGNETAFTYSVKLENSLSIDLKNLKALIPIPPGDQLNVTDDLGRALDFDEIAQGVAVTIPSLPAAQSKAILITLTVKSKTAFLNELMLSGQRALDALKENSFSSVEKQAAHLLAEFALLSPANSTNILAWFDKVQQLQEKNDSLIESVSKFLLADSQFQIDLKKSQADILLLNRTGLQKEALAATQDALQASQIMSNAQSIYAQNPDTALQQASKAQQLITIDFSALTQKLIQRQQALEKSWASLSTSVLLDENQLLENKSDFKLISQAIVGQNFEVAQELLALQENKLWSFTQGQQSALKNNALELYNQLKEMDSSAANPTADETMGVLEKNLSTYKTNQPLFEQKGFFLPFSSTDLQSLGEKSNSKLVAKADLSHLQGLIEKQKFAEAIDFYNQFYSGVTEKNKIVSDARQKLQRYYSDLESRAISSHQATQSFFAEHPVTTEINASLKKAETALSKKNFVEAIMLDWEARSAISSEEIISAPSGFFSLDSFSIPLVLLPLILIIIFMSLFKHFKKKESVEKQQNVRRIIKGSDSVP